MTTKGKGSVQRKEKTRLEYAIRYGKKFILPGEPYTGRNQYFETAEAAREYLRRTTEGARSLGIPTERRKQTVVVREVGPWHEVKEEGADHG